MDSNGRQELIRAAITFLQNPKLASSTLSDKLDFLKDKGLNQAEIDEALNLALVNRNQAQNGKWNYLLILGLCAGGYRLYKMYKEYQEQVAKKVVEQERHKEVAVKPQSDLKMELGQILDKIKSLETQMIMQQRSITSDVQSLKTLLLGHERFAAPPVIPSWQIEQNESNKEQAKSGAKEGEKSTKDKNKKKKQDIPDVNGTNGETPIAPVVVA